MPHDDIPNMFGRGSYYGFTIDLTIYNVTLKNYFLWDDTTIWSITLFLILLIQCSFVGDKVWLEANTGKVWTWCKDGNLTWWSHHFHLFLLLLWYFIFVLRLCWSSFAFKYSSPARLFCNKLIFKGICVNEAISGIPVRRLHHQAYLYNLDFYSFTNEYLIYYAYGIIPVIYLRLVQALIWSKMSTGLPIEISSSMKSQNYISFCRLDIDIHRYDSKLNDRDVVYSSNGGVFYLLMVLVSILGTSLTFIYMKSETTRRGGMELKSKLLLKEIGQLTVYVVLHLKLGIDYSSVWHCISWLLTSLLVYLQSKILHYMRQMAVITPYAQFLFRFISDASEYSLSLSQNTHVLFYISTDFPFFSQICWSKNVSIRFARRTDIMPPVPLETKYHPSAVDLLLIKRLIAETSKQNLLQFLQHEFVNLGKTYAERLIGKNLQPIGICQLRVHFKKMLNCIITTGLTVPITLFCF